MATRLSKGWVRYFGSMIGGSLTSDEDSFTEPVPWFPGKAAAVERHFSGALTLGLGFCCGRVSVFNRSR